MPTRLPALSFALGILFTAWGGPAHASQSPSPLYDHDSDRFDERPDLAEHEMEVFIKQQQDRLAQEGVKVFASYWGDFLANPIGGQDQGASWIQLVVAGAEIDLGKTIGLKGASIVTSITDVAGSNLSLEIGNVFAVPQAYLMNTFALYDLYYKQELLDGKISLSIGRMSAGRYFATLPAMVMVVSAAVNGNPSSLFFNAMYPSIGTATWGAYLKAKPAEDFYFESGVFQASARNGDPTYHGADFSIRPGDGVLMLAETGWTPEFTVGTSAPADGKTVKSEPIKLPGIYTFGAYLTDYSFDKFQGGVERNAYGFYWLAQQMVWRSRANPMHNLSLWGGVTYSPQEQIAMMPVMGMGGIIYQGLIPTRDADNVLLSFYTGGFSRSYGDALGSAGLERPTSETVIEASYIVQVTPNLQFQPDLQYIIRPGGLSSIPNALVLGFQVSLSF